MHRKLLLFALLLVSILSLPAQNLQLHFDARSSLYGKNKFPTNYTTATFELFKPDPWGATFLFVDANFDLAHGNIGMIYTEISRTFTINGFPLMPLIEYNGGLGIFEADDEVAGGYSIPNAFLAGFAYPFQLGNASFNTYIAYKYNAFKQASHDVQWTLTWAANFANNKITLCGFADVWTENKNPLDASSSKKLILMAEPQIWYNINTHLAVGSEVRVSSNFVDSGVYVCPTMGVKWEF